MQQAAMRMQPDDAAMQTDQVEMSPEQAARAEALMQETLAGLIAKLDREATERVGKRSEVEKRWLDDLRQLHGIYDPKIQAELEDAKKSQLFINQTRPKANGCEARLADMLFPTDDKNWGILPTPVPELADAAKQAMAGVQPAVDAANAQLAQGNAQQAQQIVGQAQQKADAATQAQATMDEARKRAEAMEREIDDQLTECHYQGQARDAIRDSVRIGTGVMKGPVASTDRARRGWSKVTQQDGSNVYQLGYQQEEQPAVYRVDPWSFFPDPDVTDIKDSGSNFERHLRNKKGLRELAKQPGFDRDAIRRLIKAGATKAAPTYISDLRSITGENDAPTGELFQVWEYRGSISGDDLEALCGCFGRDMPGEVDPLDEIQVVLWFCEGEAIKFGFSHLDSCETLYSVFNLEKDDASIWGFGIPYLMRDSQAALNAAWRMMMDNAGLASGPQIVIDENQLEPADGEWRLFPRKIWRRKANATPTSGAAFEQFQIESRQGDLAAIVQMARQFADDETSISQVAQGEQGTHTTQTMGGMSILMNAVNVVFRRMVKNFDDDITTPIIRRVYDWNMQFSKKDEIKGDFNVDARGSSVLLVREVQSQNLMHLIQLAGSNPLLAAMLKIRQAFRKLVQSMMIPADELVKSDDEMDSDEQKVAQQPPPPDPEATKADLAMKLSKLDSDTKIYVANSNRDVAMMTLASKQNMKLDDLRAMLQNDREERDHKERMFTAEAAVTATQPPGEQHGGGSF